MTAPLIDPDYARCQRINAAEEARRAQLDARELRRLCDEDAIEDGFRAIARIRRDMQLKRANRAVAYERIAAAHRAAVARRERKVA